jgi:hypothetical protein
MNPDDRHAWNQLAKVLHAAGKALDGINAQIKTTEIALDDSYQ